MDIAHAQKIMGRDFIGQEELTAMCEKLNIALPEASRVPRIALSEKELTNAHRDGYLLILGILKSADGEKLTLNKMRARFGTDPARSEPCFYNQDWYLSEQFARDTTLECRWYLLRKTVEEGSRGRNPGEIADNFQEKEYFPPAVLTAFAFFAYYVHTGGETLWEHDFLWCSDLDANSDRIYTGRYRDPRGIAKNGFNIHRHLTIRNGYGVAPMR